MEHKRGDDIPREGRKEEELEARSSILPYKRKKSMKEKEGESGRSPRINAVVLVPHHSLVSRHIKNWKYVREGWDWRLGRARKSRTQMCIHTCLV